MAHYLNDDLEFVNDGYFDFVEFDDEGFEIDYEEEGHDADLDGLGSPVWLQPDVFLSELLSIFGPCKVSSCFCNCSECTKE